MAHYLTMFIIAPLYFNPCGVTKIAKKTSRSFYGNTTDNFCDTII